MEMKKEKIQKKIKKLLAVIYKNNLLEVIFILLNLINALLLRINTVNNGLRYSPFIIDLSFLLVITLLAQKIKIKKIQRCRIGRGRDSQISCGQWETEQQDIV